MKISVYYTHLGMARAEAVARALSDAVGPDCPASIPRRHADSHLYPDSDSAGRLEFPELKSCTLPAVFEING